MTTEPEPREPLPERRRARLLSMRRMRTVAVLPTMFTLGNLVCGFFSIVVAARVEAPTSAATPVTREIGAPTQFDKTDETHNVMLSAWLIFLAMVFDALDGQVARLSRSFSDFGAQLDSLCDLVAFGVAPGFLLVKMCPVYTFESPETVWIIAALFPACAALRLARFNVETGDDDDHLHFKGLPSPAAAGSIAGFAILFYTIRRPGSTHEFIDSALQHILPWFAVAVGALMVSRLPYPHIVNQMFRGHRSFAHVVALLFALVAIMAFRGYAVPLLFAGFVLGPPIWFLIQVIARRREQKEPLF